MAGYAFVVARPIATSRVAIRDSEHDVKVAAKAPVVEDRKVHKLISLILLS